MGFGMTSETAHAIQAARRGLTPDQWHDRKVEIMEMAWDSGLPYRVIAQRFRVSISTVVHLARYGPGVSRARAATMPAFKERTPEDNLRIVARAGIAKAAKFHGVTPEEWTVIRGEVIHRAEAGERQVDLAREYGLDRGTVHRIVGRHRRLKRRVRK